MKKWLAFLGLWALVAQSAVAWRPVGWVYGEYPWAYEASSGDWYWFNTTDVQWVCNMYSGNWWLMEHSALRVDWSFFNWPYAYARSNGAWNYINEVDTQWVVNMRTAQWSRFGELQNYLIIDLSEGPDAERYPISYLSSVPTGGWKDEYKSTKLVLRHIQPGSFTMGSPTAEVSRADTGETQHSVTLTKDYYIGVFEVTQKQWERVMGTWPSYFTNASYRESRPVEQVSYNDIRGTAVGTNWPASNTVDENSFMGRLRARTGQACDLPTEAQWEYAGRAGTTTALNSGYDITNKYSDARMAEVGRYLYNGGSVFASDGDTSVATAKAGSYLANTWGLYDMHGNVSEWCLDWYSSQPTGELDPLGAGSGTSRLVRSGRWGSGAGGCRSAGRGSLYSDDREFDTGFRLGWTLY